MSNWIFGKGTAEITATMADGTVMRLRGEFDTLTLEEMTQRYGDGPRILVNRIADVRLHGVEARMDPPAVPLPPRFVAA